MKPIYIQQAGYSTIDVLNMIDLALTLVKRKTMIAVIFSIITALGIFAALLTPREYTFSTTIDIGSRIIEGSIEPFESPQALLTKLKYSYIPQVLTERRESFPNDKTKYRIRPSVPSDGNLVLLEIIGTEEQSDTLKELLNATSDKAIQEHTSIYESIKRSLEAGLGHATADSESQMNYNRSEIKTFMHENIIGSLASQLANLRSTKVALSPMRSLDPTGRSRKTIVAASAFAGVFLGIFVAFFAEFLSKVKLRIAKDET